MTREISIKTEYILKDLEPILCEGSRKALKTRNGYTPPEEARYYLIALAHDAYMAGAHRVETELNRQADKEVADAQRKAAKKLMKMTY